MSRLFQWSSNEGLGRQFDAERVGVRDADRAVEVDHLPDAVLPAIDDRHPERALLLPDAEAHAVIDRPAHLARVVADGRDLDGVLDRVWRAMDDDPTLDV